QQRLWFLDQLVPGNSFYNVPMAMSFKGELKVEVLERSFSEIVRRHESLRTTFKAENGRAVQVINPAYKVVIVEEDLSGEGEEERGRSARELAWREAQEAFDLSEGPLMRVKLIKLGREEHVILLTMHHIVSDGWSIGVLGRELTTLYKAYEAGDESPLKELEIQYGDYAVWQRNWLSGEELNRQMEYWRKQLKGIKVLEIPADRSRPAVQSYSGGTETLRLGEELTRELREVSQREKVTIFMLMLGIYQVLLQKYSGE